MAGMEATCGFYFVFAMITFYIWMDMSFYGEVYEYGSLYNESMAERMVFPVKSVKLRMQDHTGHYIRLPLMRFINEKWGISKIPGITPNLISGLHLFVAIVAGKLVSYGSLCIRRMGVLLFEIRSQLDLLDGVVYRAQSNMKNTFVSGWGTYGYLIDAFTDMAGGIILGIGCLVYLRKYPPVKRQTLKLRDVESGKKYSLIPGDEDERRLPQYESRKTITIQLIVSVAMIIIRGGLWDNYLKTYHELLEVPSSHVSKVVQAEVLNWKSTWLVMWLWKVSSGDACLHWTVLSVLFDKLWGWMKILNYCGPPQLVLLVIITQIHLMQVHAFLQL